MTVREALRDAMAEEMRRDEAVFVMGEEVAEYQGAYKVTQGLLQEFGAAARGRHADHRAWLCRPRRRRGAGRAETDRRVHDLQLRHAGDGPDHQFGGQDPLHVGRPDRHLDRVPRAERRGRPRRRPAQPGLLGLVLAHSGPEGDRALHRADAKGLLKAAIRDPNPVIFLENEILYGQSFPVPKLDDFVLPIGKARIARAGKDVTIVSFSMGMSYALKAADELAKEGIEAEVIDLRTLRPMDTETIIASVKKTGRIVTVEEGWPQAGIGAEIAARVMRARVRLSRRAGHARRPARTCRCRTRPTWKSSRCRRSPKWSRRRRRSATGSAMANGDDDPRVYQALALPDKALEDGGVEILRLGIIDDELYVSALPAFSAPAQWGEVLAEVARRLGAIYAAQNAGPRPKGRHRPDRRSLRRRNGRAAGEGAGQRRAKPKAAATKSRQPNRRPQSLRPDARNAEGARCRSTFSCRRCRPRWRRATLPSG